MLQPCSIPDRILQLRHGVRRPSEEIEGVKPWDPKAPAGRTKHSVQVSSTGALRLLKLFECGTVRVERNHIAAPILWKDCEGVGELAGRPVRLHFNLRVCKLCGFQFESEG